MKVFCLLSVRLREFRGKDDDAAAASRIYLNVT